MGMVIGRFRKKKETTIEVLDKLESKIKSIEEFANHTEQTQKKVVGRFIVISILIYCLVVFAIYFHYFPASAYERFTYILPLIILPLILMSIKRIVSWYFNRKIRKNREVVSSLKSEKKKILEEVMDKETYKVAKQILEKFSNEPPKRNLELTPLRPLPSGFSPAPTATGPRYRSSALTSTISQKAAPTSTPLPSRMQSLTSMSYPKQLQTTSAKLPRSILPRDRSVLDKMVDYLVGDGPSNRYALICKTCSSHNGMALKDEFDYLSFKCCYCSTFNPARKQKPIAPRLELTGPVIDTASSESDSSTSEEEEQPQKIVEQANNPFEMDDEPAQNDSEHEADGTVMEEAIPEDVKDTKTPTQD